MVRLAGRLIGPAVLLVIAAVLVTGLIVPGWLVENRFRTTATPDVGGLSRPLGTAPHATGAQARQLRRFAGDYVRAFNERDVAGIAALACDRPSQMQLGSLATALRLGGQTATVSGQPKVTGERASVPVTLRSTAKLSGHRTVPRTVHSAVLAQRRGTGWCLR